MVDACRAVAIPALHLHRSVGPAQGWLQMRMMIEVHRSGIEIVLSQTQELGMLAIEAGDVGIVLKLPFFDV